MKGIKLTEEQKNQIKLSLNLNIDLPIVLVFGGSQGARVINNAMSDIIKNKKLILKIDFKSINKKQYKKILKRLLHIKQLIKINKKIKATIPFSVQHACYACFYK